MSHDLISDFLTIIRNGIMASRPHVVVPFSHFRFDIASILKQEGFIKDVVLIENGLKSLKIFFRYVDGESAIHELKRVSTSGRRVYKRFGAFKPVIGGLGVAIVTTSKGVMTDKRARQMAVGGEVICTVW